MLTTNTSILETSSPSNKQVIQDMHSYYAVLQVMTPDHKTKDAQTHSPLAWYTTAPGSLSISAQDTAFLMGIYLVFSMEKSS